MGALFISAQLSADAVSAPQSLGTNNYDFRSSLTTKHPRKYETYPPRVKKEKKKKKKKREKKEEEKELRLDSNDFGFNNNKEDF